MDAFGRVDILINNAGILRDKSFMKMSDDEFSSVMDVHVLGTHRVTHAAWPIMISQGFGRVIMTGSAAGIYGNYGQTNYGAAKYGLAGMAKSLAREGQKKNVLVNYIAPLAASRITEAVLPESILNLLKPEKVAPFVGFLCHETCQSTGEIFELGGGYVARVDFERSKGLLLSGENLKPEKILSSWDKVIDFQLAPEYPKNITDVDWVGLAESSKLIKDTIVPSINVGALSLKGKAAIVTGAGGGLGRVYSLALGALGCSVLVNDLSPAGSDGRRPSEKVASEIREAGGVASINYLDITKDANSIVKHCLEIYGRVDILINNAGILRDKSYLKMSDEEFRLVLNVHLGGTVQMSKSVLPHMEKQGFGRIVNTTSAVGLYGNFGQVNYSTAKAAILGFSRSLSKEMEKLRDGGRVDIRINVIAPNAGTAMTATILPEEIVSLLKPNFVAPLVALLCSQQCPSQGGLYEVGSGWQAAVRMRRTKFQKLNYKNIFETISDLERSNKFEYPENAVDSLKAVLLQIESESASCPTTSKTVFRYSVRDVLLYHLGLGLKETKYTYENDPEFSVLSSFGVLPAMDAILPPEFYTKGTKPNWMQALGDNFNPMMLLHGEQELEILKGSFSKQGEITSTVKVADVQVKEKGTVLTFEVNSESSGSNSSKVLMRNKITLFLRGFVLTESQMNSLLTPDKTTEKALTNMEEFSWDSDKKVLKSTKMTDVNQAVLYRLSGDYNPLHVDKGIAKAAGFPRPILHGLASFGMTVAALEELTGCQATYFKARFTRHVFPGEEILVESQEMTKSVWAVRALVGDRVILDQAVFKGKLMSQESEILTVQSRQGTSKDTEQASLNGFSAIHSRLVNGWHKLSPADQKGILAKEFTIVFTSLDSNESFILFQFKPDSLDPIQLIASSSKRPTSDLTIALPSKELLASFLLEGIPDPQSAFMKGQLKIVSGNMNIAMSLQPLLKRLQSKLK